MAFAVLITQDLEVAIITSVYSAIVLLTWLALNTPC
jgi:hypothetical protein